MRLYRLHIIGFGRLRERVITFDPRLTLLYGPNETGKSTVLHCLSQVLFGRPTQRSSFPDFTPWDGGPFAAELEFVEHGTRYRLSRRLHDGGGRAQALYQLRTDGSEQLVTQENAEIRKWISAALGTADDRIFYRVFCLTQADLTPFDNFNGLREHLERAISGADVAVTTAIQRIDERLSALRRGVNQPALTQNWGALKVAGEARRDWDVRLLESRRQQRRLHEVREAADALRRQITETDARIDFITGLLEDERRRRDLLNRLAELRSSWVNIDSELERTTRLTDEQDRLHDLLQKLPPACADPPVLRGRLSVAERGNVSGAWLGGAIITTGILSAVLIGIHHLLLGAITAVLAALAGCPLILRAIGHRREVTALCRELGVLTLAEAAQRLDAAERYRRELDATALALQTMTDVEALQTRRRALALDIATTEAMIDQMPGTAISGEEAHRLAQELSTLHAAVPSLRERERTLLSETAVLEDSERDLVDLEDGAAYWRQEEARAQEEESCLALARELLLDAGQQAHRALADPLTAGITPLFSAMTGGRYPQVQVEGGAKTFRVHPIDIAGSPVPPEQLSRGAADQFMLAVRLALGQVIAGPTGTPFFLLDDPLLHFDDDRRCEALALLNTFSATTQLILATHDPRIVAALPHAGMVRFDA